MKKGLCVLLSVVLVLTLAVSFSVPVKAAPVTFVYSKENGNANAFWYVDSIAAIGTPGIDRPDVLFPGDSSDFVHRIQSNATDYIRIGSSSSDKGFQIFTYEDIPADVEITVKFQFSVDFPTIAISSYEFPSSFKLVNPSAPSVFSHRVVSLTSTGRTFEFVCTFLNPSSTNQFDFGNAYIYANYSSKFNIEYPFTVSFDSFELSYEYEESELDVLQNIRDNTAETNNKLDNMTNGFDNSGMNDQNQQLGDSLNNYNDLENQATQDSYDNIDAAEFVSVSANQGIFSSIMFCSTFLQSLFVNLGDFSLLVVVSLALALGLMLIGWFKYR